MEYLPQLGAAGDNQPTEIEALDIDLDGKEPLELVNTWRCVNRTDGKFNGHSLDTQCQRSVKCGFNTSHGRAGDSAPLVLPAPRARVIWWLLLPQDGKKQIFYSILGYENGRVVGYPGKYINTR